MQKAIVLYDILYTIVLVTFCVALFSWESERAVAVKVSQRFNVILCTPVKKIYLV